MLVGHGGSARVPERWPTEMEGGGDGRLSRERGLRLAARGDERGDVGSRGFGISCVKMMHFANSRWRIVSVLASDVAVGVGEGGSEGGCVVLSGWARGPEEIWGWK